MGSTGMHRVMIAEVITAWSLEGSKAGVCGYETELTLGSASWLYIS